ncbi:hypothetical protein [Sediminibacillus halophilus]|uniref:Lipoprotein n=1 Tax=Sediminibacillus halophilus TaxID=482461 RepID=A0A1G9R5L3_9BACI|nr:hypothetical protein [Sediminibacillus halophilus]SDM18596.1 hypothetical protein SAMN05216244_1834 [Sediminibacillus halophilus]
MKSRIGLMLLFLMFLLVLGACQNGGNAQESTEQEQEEKNYLYESETVKVTETSGWSKHDSPSNDGEENILFQNDNVKAILTLVSDEKSLDEIKNELKSSFGNTEAIEENEKYLSLKSNRKESVRTDIYLDSGDEQTGILIFMTPFEEYEKNQAVIEEFKKNVQFY